MYKVFVNDCPIILTDDKKIITDFEIIEFDNAPIVELVKKLLEGRLKGIYLICSDLKKCWKTFKSNFKIHKAAGGKVLNEKNEVLFIYRFGRWDLPKGKLNKGETIKDCAIREVQEECGIDNLELIKPLDTTYHIFERNNKYIFKITYWFLMKTSGLIHLVPQTEEGIEQVIFKDEIEVKKALNNTYENIKLLF